MNRFYSMAALLALTTGGMATQATAEDSAPAPTTAPLTATAGMDINSAYIWRGVTANNGLVFQPSMDIAKNGFDFNVWANYDAADYHDTVEQNKFSEVDLTASYTFKTPTQRLNQKTTPVTQMEKIYRVPVRFSLA